MGCGGDNYVPAKNFSVCIRRLGKNPGDVPSCNTHDGLNLIRVAFWLDRQFFLPRSSPIVLIVMI